MSNFVQWHEGMLLSPQHFQQADNNIQHLFSLFGASSSAFLYGVRELEIDTSCLASGIIRVLKVNGIFQDGYCFDFDAIHDQALERNLSEYFITTSVPIKIYLGIAARRETENELEGDMARYYSSENVNIPDRNTGDNFINIPILKPKLKLLLEEEIDARYTSFPIFEAEKSIEGGIVSTNFLPPYITIDEHSEISKMCREIAQIIRYKVSYFSDRKNSMRTNVTEETMASLRLLIQSVLPLEAIIKINGIQPFEVYKYLINSIAKIISINPTQMIPMVPIYNHQNLYKTFHDLFDYAKSILDALKQQYHLVNFEQEENIFKLQLKKEWLQKDEISIGLIKSPAATDDDLVNWIRGVQIASESMITMLRDHRVLGAERRIVDRGEYITQPNNMRIIAVKSQSAYIKPMEKLCLVNPAQSIIPEGVVLYADF